MEFCKNTIMLENKEFYTLNVSLPKTNLLIVGNDIGFIMCGALNVDIYDSEKLKPRGVVCANAVGVKDIEGLLNGRINKATTKAYELGIKEGMMVRDALSLLS